MDHAGLSHAETEQSAISPSRRAVFFDRDGTVMEEVHYCADPALVHVLPGVADQLRRLRENHWLTIMVTNQSGIGRGYFSVAQYEAVQKELLRQLEGQMDATYYCPDAPDQASLRRKPGIGMIQEAVRDWNIDLRKSYFVGDNRVDVECGCKAGLQTLLVLTGHGERDKDCEPRPHHISTNAVEAIEWILANAECGMRSAE